MHSAPATSENIRRPLSATVTPEKDCTDAGATLSGAPEGKQELARGQPGIFRGIFGWQPMLGASRDLA